MEQLHSTEVQRWQTRAIALRAVAGGQSRLLGQWYEAHGIEVIPSVNWSTPESFDFCFSGLPTNSVLITSGCCVEEPELYLAGLEKAMPSAGFAYARLSPKKILVYGDANRTRQLLGEDNLFVFYRHYRKQKHWEDN